MSKIDEMVRYLMLAYPTLHHNRFEAFVELMTNSAYKWDKSGNLEYVFEPEEVSTELMLKEFKDELADAVEKAGRDKMLLPQLTDLNRRVTAEATRELLLAQHVADNLDIYVTEWTACGYAETWAFLWKCHRHGISQYWSVNNKPDNIDEEWRLAIREWLGHILPSLNNLMGMNTPERFVAVPGYEKTFNWVTDTYKAYETEADRVMSEDMRKIADEIVSEIIREEKTRGPRPT